MLYSWGKVNQFTTNLEHFPPPPPVQTGRLSPPCEPCHATPGFCDICPAGQKYGSRLGPASLTACRHVPPVVSGARGLPAPLDETCPKHANANKFALLSASMYIRILKV